MTASGKIGAMAGTMFKVIGTGWALTIVFLVLLYTLAGVLAGRNPFAMLWRMLPAYLTGLSIASSSAVLPVTLECCEKNGISKDIRDFTVPLCANAAPGVMSGVLMASVGLMESIVGFTPEQVGLLMTFYLALDGYGPAANVTGDGAIALIIDRFFGSGKV